ncbi:hypothetical protein ASD54_12230 [Rhizobium sp. Root149]|uniref:hypothetical protein n=1 Tax=Rhizobium sp. Root149 TaxID=1736473 RepID=UPI00071297E4|nr:hypothetical protein [Rhizobium sp. Root149]KQZ49699.1 hypothetical protein ASD54_12230 [Rhizobium sp. Root149]
MSESSKNEVVVVSGRKIAIGSEWWEIRKDDAPVQFVDIVTEMRPHHGNVYISLGSAIIDANNAPIVDMAARLRMDLGTAQNLHKLLGDVISAVLKPIDDSIKN